MASSHVTDKEVAINETESSSVANNETVAINETAEEEDLDVSFGSRDIKLDEDELALAEQVVQEDLKVSQVRSGVDFERAPKSTSR